MISKNKIKLYHSLLRKKQRDQLSLFVAEGEKLIAELASAQFKFHSIVGTSETLKTFSAIDCEKIETDYSDIKKISFLKTPQPIIAIVYQKKQLQYTVNKNELVLALDSIQDPGNMGTIIRIASWFGIQNIVCSTTTVDQYNPKVVQATMGALAHVNIIYDNLDQLLSKSRAEGIPIYGTFLEGSNIYKTKLSSNGIIVLGNEGNGISKTIENIVDQKLHIPTFSDQSVESLNVSVATAILCSEFRRITL